jgi:diketogulonate reductase-like aldo/keto reductase
MTPAWKSAFAGGSEISRLGFGCAAVGGRVSRRDSLAAMGVAFDAGVNFFDSARSYGFGQSEAIVGEFLRGRPRSSVVVCTKFGILPAQQAGWKQRLRPAARTVMRLFPGLRKAAQRQIRDQFVGGQFSVPTLEASLGQSLRELGTDYVDMLLMHAAPRSVLEQHDLLEALGRVVESGKVRVAGISGELPVMEEVFTRRPAEMRTAQFTLNLSNIGFAEQTRGNADLLLVGNQPFGGRGGAEAIRAKIDTLRRCEGLPESVRERLDLSDPQLLPELVLNCVLQGTGLTATVAAMMQPPHIENNVRAVRECRFSVEELEFIREQIVAMGSAAGTVGR